MKNYTTKILLPVFLVFAQSLFFSTSSSSAPYNNNWQLQQQQQAAQRAAQAQRDARMAADAARRNARVAAERARRNAQIAAERAKIAARQAASNAKKEAARASGQAKRNAKNIANQNKKNALRSAQNQNLRKNQKIQSSRIQEKLAQDQQNKRAMERAIQKTIQIQKQKVANDNQLRIKGKLNKLKRNKQLKKRERKKKQLAEKKKKDKKNNDQLIRQTLNQKDFQPASNKKPKSSAGGGGRGNNNGKTTVASGGGKRGRGGDGGGSNRKVENETAKLRQIHKNQSLASTKSLNAKINNKVTKGVGKEIRILRDAAKGKGNFGLGFGSRAEADKLGKAWVGDGYKVASDGKTLVGKDGLRQYRPPSYKGRLRKTQANFEQKFLGQKTKGWQSNGHLDITD